nr:RluA family pseudouridine synthase [Geomicrobium halophilum]
MKIEKKMSTRMIKKIRRFGELQVNGKPAVKHQELLPGDVVCVVPPEEQFPAHFQRYSYPLSVIYEDAHLLILNKPAPMATMPGHGEKGESLAEAVMAYYETKKFPGSFHAVGRLDRGTSGIMIVGKHGYAHDKLTRFTEYRPNKRYVAFVEGSFPDGRQVIDDPIQRHPDSLIERQIGGDKPAITIAEKRGEGGGVSLVELTLITGRTHQLRVHLAARGYPIVGDTLYGSSSLWIKRQALHSIHTRFQHPITEKMYHLTAPFPRDLQPLFSKMGADILDELHQASTTSSNVKR